MTAVLLRTLALLCLALVPPLEAQVRGTYPVRRYGTEQGLESEVVAALVQDRSGMLWVGTDGGLCFFDGRRFSPFKGELPSQSVLSLLSDLDGALWVATEGGLTRIHRGKSWSIDEAQGIPPGPVQDVARDAEGHLWVLTAEGIRVEQGSNGFMAPGLWKDQDIPTHLFADPALSGAWAITTRNIWHWEQNHWTRLDSPLLASGEALLDMAVDGDQDLWVRTSRSLWRLPAKGVRTWVGARMVGGHSHISRLSRDVEGWVWVDNTEGLWRIRGDQRVQFGHAQDEARGGMVDQEGGLWLRTDKGVLRVLGQTHWRSYGKQDGLPVETTWQMVRDPLGRLWVGTDSGLWVVQGRQFKRVAPGRFLNIMLSKDGRIWASGSPAGTVYEVNTQTLVAKALRIPSLPVARITAGMTIDAEGHLWVADEQRGVVRGRHTSRGWVWENISISGSTPRHVWAIKALPGGQVLLMHNHSMSLWWHGTWRPVPDLLPATPFIADASPDGRVIIGYRNRAAMTVHRMAGENLVRTAVLDFTPPGEQLGLYSLAIGTHDRIWVGTTHGLGYLDHENLSSFRLLGTEDRILSAECNQSALLVEAEQIWIGTPAGLMSYDPVSTRPQKKLLAPVIVSAQAGSKDLGVFDSIPELPRANNELEVHFMVPNYQGSGPLRYAAKLSGVDVDWIQMDTPHLRYAGLRAGPHTLELRGLSLDGGLGPVTSFHFRVRPAWWERWWVRILGLCGLGGMIFGIVKARQAQLERRNRDLVEEVAKQTSALVAASKAKSAFLANMSHELRTPLNAILLYSEIMQEDMQDPAMSAHRSDAGRIHSAGKHLLGLIDDILDMSKIEAGHLRLELQEIEVFSFLHDLEATVRPLVEKNGNRLELDIQKVPDHICSDPIRLRQILVNLLSNSAKFTNQGFVRLKAWTEGDHLWVEVKDSGIGMTEDQQTRVFNEFVQADDSTSRKFGGTGLGLTLVKTFTDLLGGKLTLHSVPDQGTTFTLAFPVAGPPPSPGSGAYRVESPSKA